MTDIRYKFVGFLRGLSAVVLVAVLAYIGDASHLTFVSNPFVIGLIVSVAGAIEHSLEVSKGKALFGVIKV